MCKFNYCLSLFYFFLLPFYIVVEKRYFAAAKGRLVYLKIFLTYKYGLDFVLVTFLNSWKLIHC